MSIFKPCASHDAFEFIPKREKVINLTEVSKRFENIKIKTNIILVVNYNGVDVSIYKSGRMIIHTKNPSDAESIAIAIRGVIDV